MRWWHAKDHPVWTCAQMVIGAFVLAYMGAEHLDVKDVGSVLGGTGLGFFLRGRS